MKKGLIKILLANIISLVINILNSFLLPKYLSVDTYAILKTYTFYVGYAGFLSLGFADGMYLKYGGEELNNIDYRELGTSLRSYIVMEGIICSLMAVVALAMGNLILLAVAFGAFFINIIGYYKNLYQAVGEYGLYGRSLNYQTILLFLTNLFFLFVIHSDDANAYVVIQVASALLIAFYLSVLIQRKTHLFAKGQTKLVVMKENVLSGFTLMLGNFSSSLFTGLDRWFVKILMDNASFALYSFAVSLENIINVFVTPITISLYNAFCKRRDVPYVRGMKSLSMLWGLFIVAAAFPVKIILTHYLTAYQDAAGIIFPLFAAQIFYAIIKGIHVNLYKAEQKQKKYFFIMLILLVIATVLNAIFYYIFKTEQAFAFATLATAIIWFVYCEIESPEYRFLFKEYCTLAIMLAVYFLTCQMSNSILGFAVYIGALILISCLLMKNTMKTVFNLVKKAPAIVRRK